MDNSKNHIGREIPAHKGAFSLRSFMKRGTVFAMGAAAALTPLKSEAQEVHPLHSPIAAERVEGEIAALEAAYQGRLDIVNVTTEDYAEANGGMIDLDGPEGSLPPMTLFYHPQFDRLEADLFQAFSNAGMFRLGEGEQYRDPASYFPDSRLPELQDINETLAAHQARLFTSTLINPTPTSGLAEIFDFSVEGQEKPNRVCLTVMTPSIADEDSFMQGFTKGLNTRGHDIELADIYQFVANHELAHCMNTNGEMPSWLNETLADIYAITRHYQLNGEDGFADMLMHARYFSAATSGGHSHYTVPGLREALPKIREAFENNELDGLNPREIRDFTIKIMFGEGEEEITRNAAAFAQRQQIEVDAFTGAGAVLYFDETRTLVPKPDAPEGTAERYQEVIERTNAAYAYLTRPNPSLDLAEVNSTEAERDFRLNMNEYVATQESRQVALNGIRARLFSMQNIETAFIEARGIENLHQLHAAYGSAKMTFARQREIFQQYERELTPEITQEQDRDELGMSVG